MPLTSWTCDSCGQDILDPQRGLLIWREEDLRGYDYRLVHKNIDGRHCDPGSNEGFISNVEIDHFLGPEGQAALLSMLSVGPMMHGDNQPRVKDFDAFVDIFRRLQVPWYEEAREHFDDELTQHYLGDANEIYPYIPDVLERIATADF